VDNAYWTGDEGEVGPVVDELPESDARAAPIPKTLAKARLAIRGRFI
jgi:hypothetical protein